MSQQTGVTKQMLISDLERINDALEATNAGKGYICIAGSSALLLGTQGFANHRLSLDVDVMRCSDNVLRVMEVCENDFNNAVSTFDNPESSYIKTQNAGFGFDMLQVDRLSNETSAIMKLITGRDKDLDDVKAVLPELDKKAITQTLKSLDFQIEMPDPETVKAVQSRWTELSGESFDKPRERQRPQRLSLRERRAQRAAAKAIPTELSPELKAFMNESESHENDNYDIEF